VSDAAQLIEGWRAEVAGQWPPGGLRVDRESLVGLLKDGEALRLDPQAVLWAVLGAEWLLRARPATKEDVEAEMAEIRRALIKGSTDPNHAVLVEHVAGRALRRALKQSRFLVSYQAFTVPSGWVLMRFARGAGGLEPKAWGQPVRAVQVRRGPVTRLGPIVGAILAQGIVERSTGQKAKSDRFACALAATMLKRKVLLPEFRKWKTRASVKITDPSPEHSEPERRRTLRDWLLFRFERVYRNTRGDRRWDQLYDEADRNPKFAFTCVGDQEVARMLYGLKWG
jgi:hypothetical protein